MLWRLLRLYLRPYWKQLGTVALLQLAGVIATLALPSINGHIIDQGVATGDTTYVLVHGGFMLAISALQILTAIAAVYVGARIAIAYGRDLRAGIFHHVGLLSAREVGKLGAPFTFTEVANWWPAISVATYKVKPDGSLVDSATNAAFGGSHVTMSWVLHPIAN